MSLTLRPVPLSKPMTRSDDGGPPRARLRLAGPRRRPQPHRRRGRGAVTRRPLQRLSPRRRRRGRRGRLRAGVPDGGRGGGPPRRRAAGGGRAAAVAACAGGCLGKVGVEGSCLPLRAVRPRSARPRPSGTSNPCATAAQPPPPTPTTRAQADCARRLAATQALLKTWAAKARPAAARRLAAGPRAALQLGQALKRLARPGPGCVRGVVPSMMNPAEKGLVAHQVGCL